MKGELFFDRFGKPSEVVRWREVELSPDAIGKGQVRVEMLYASINPADLNFIEGVYGVKPELPAVPGIEGVGKVVESMSEDLEPGQLVIPLERLGTWRSEFVASASQFAPVPNNIDPVQASMLKVNPATAWCLLKEFVDLKEGDWILQNASNSSVGQCVIQLAKHFGIKTINCVRRKEPVAHLQELGADAVVMDQKGATVEILDRTKGMRPKIAFNAVGGDSALLQLDVLAEGGTQVTYGAMSRRSLKVPNKFLIFKNLSLQGLWITKLLKEKPYKEVYAIYHDLAQMVMANTLHQKVQQIYSPFSYTDALNSSSTDKRNGKILFQINQ